MYDVATHFAHRTSGPDTEGSQAAAFDFKLPYLRHMLGFLGLNDVTVIDADKQAFAPEAARQSVEMALQQVSGTARNAAPALVAAA